MYEPQTVRLFVKPYCPWCQQAIRWLDTQGIHYELLDVLENNAAYEAMVGLSGQSLAPVIDRSLR